MVLDKILILGKMRTYMGNILHLPLLIMFVSSKSMTIGRILNEVEFIEYVLILYKACRWHGGFKILSRYSKRVYFAIETYKRLTKSNRL